MSKEPICTEDFRIRFTNPPGGGVPTVPPGLTYTGDLGADPIKVIPTYSQAVRWRNRRIVTQQVVITFTALTGGCPYTSTVYTFVAGSAMIQTSTLVTRAEQRSVLRKGDRSMLGCIGSWTAPNGATITCKCDAEIVEAGQDRVKTE